MSEERPKDVPACRYTMGYDEAFRQFLERRNAAACAGHLLPHLEPGTDLLDLGCGPGSISRGLARAVAPGRMQGVDMEESQIDIARAAAEADGLENARFLAGDVLDLPFGADSFDVVHCHALFMHVPDTRALLGEIRRVLRPGGLLSVRDLVGSASFLETGHGDLDGMMNAFIDLIEANRGHGEMGRKLKRHLMAAGLVDVRMSFGVETYDTVEDIRFFANFVRDWFFNPRTTADMIRHELATEEDIRNWRGIVARFLEEPGDSVFNLTWGAALGRNP